MPRSEGFAPVRVSKSLSIRWTSSTSARLRWPTSRSRLRSLEQDKFAIVEKPLTGYFGDGSEEFNGDTFPKQDALDQSLESIERILAKPRTKSKGKILYAENWIYAPSIQKEREIIEKTGAQILWIHGEEAHSGSHAATYAYWKFSGGGVMIGKGCHPLTAALYLKRVEGIARNGEPIKPRGGLGESPRDYQAGGLPGRRTYPHVTITTLMISH